MVKSAGRPLEPLDVCQGLMYMLPDGLRETLLPFQRDGVLYGLRRKGRCLIADEMGTGKVCVFAPVRGAARFVQFACGAARCFGWLGVGGGGAGNEMKLLSRCVSLGCWSRCMVRVVFIGVFVGVDDDVCVCVCARAWINTLKRCFYSGSNSVHPNSVLIISS